ncbi:MAG: site-2 protease family protein [Methermicoccaceae archaeon]
MDYTTWKTIFAVATFVLVYWLVVEHLKKRGTLERYNISAYGPVLMIRTTRGQKVLDALARPKTLWRAYADAGIPLLVAGMLVMTAFLLFFDLLLMTAPPKPTVLNEPRNLLLIPGLNQFIPLGYGLVALFVTLVVHELSHALLCRVEGIRVKSMGIITLVLPIGGFAEPDESQLFEKEEQPQEKVASRRERMRILTAGVMSNYVVALIAFVLFFASLYAIAPVGYSAVILGVEEGSPAYNVSVPQESIILSINGIATHTPEQVVEVLESTPPHSDVVLTVLKGGRRMSYTLPFNHTTVSTEGLLIRGVVKGSPAEGANLTAGMRITAMDGVPVRSLTDFSRFMRSTHPAQSVVVEINGTEHYTIRLASSPQNSSMGFLGVYYSERELVSQAMGLRIAKFPASDYLNALRNLPFHLTKPTGWLTLLTLPILQTLGGVGFAGFSGILSGLYQPVGAASVLGGGWLILSGILFWIGWVNLNVALFNCLPAVPLDGGHVFRDLLTGLFERFTSKDRAERLAHWGVMLLAYTVFLSILLMVIGPHIASQW